MNDGGEIVWLASYPKSGNTWVRLLLGKLLGLKEEEDEQEQFAPVASITSSRWAFDYHVGVNSFDLTDAEIDSARPGLYREIARHTDGLGYMKAHDAYQRLDDGTPIFPADCSRGALYMVRHPLDVAVSFAHHRGQDTYERTAKVMMDTTKSLGGGKNGQMRQLMGDWSQHYRSWIDQSEIPVCLVKYEDLHRDTVGTVKRIVQFIGLQTSDLKMSVEEAVDATRFDRLQKLEDKSGFHERPEKAQRFFRSGKVGEGREALSREIQDSLTTYHAEVMRELGYQ